ncbi:MAG: hypothetical protein E7773_10040 [Sphingomonas sp.]|uniref:hypothetical protein n=1 Tax=Sphingomonas sp. TaxID=28214 RepID=UPI0012090141|nr:hypothetical protein [Sphingomonas sp.]THD36246.1 MAG: hypothetical protein E7773_10040 [Sphingomonas sp.]
MIALPFLLAALSGPLAPFDRLVGHCWSTDIAPGTADRHCFASLYGGAHVRDTHQVRRGGAVVYAGETIYSAEGDAIVFTYVNSLGGVGRGTASVDGGAITFRLTMRTTPASTPQAMTTIWRIAADGYETSSDGVVRRFRRDD